MLTGVIQSNRVWRASRTQPAVSHKPRSRRGTTVSFRLDERARVSFVFVQLLPGRTFNGRCHAQTRRNRDRQACTRTVIRVSLSLAGHRGANKVFFRASTLRSAKFKPGRYTLLIAATNSAGQQSRLAALTFKILKQ